MKRHTGESDYIEWCILPYSEYFSANEFPWISMLQWTTSIPLRWKTLVS